MPNDESNLTNTLAEDIVHNGDNLSSLGNAQNGNMRLIAVRNLQYYPEHLSILIGLLSTETDVEILTEIEVTLLKLSEDKSLINPICEKLHLLRSTLADGEPASTCCNRVLGRLANKRN